MENPYDHHRPCTCERKEECYGGLYSIRCQIEYLTQLVLPLTPTYDALKSSDDDD